MFLVYIETLKMSKGDERLEILANTINFRDDGGILSRENLVSVARRCCLEYC